MSLVNTRRKMEQMLPLVAVFVAIFILGIFLSFNMGSNAGPAAPGADLFARINGEEVTNTRFAQMIEQTRDQFRMFAQSGQGITVQQQAEYPKYAYERLLDEYAQAAAARANGINVSDSEVQAEAKRLIDQRLEQLKEGSTPQELSQYRAILSANIDTESMRRQMLAQRLRDKFTAEARPVEVKAAHVLIKTDKRTDAQARKLAEEIARRARAGEDFGKLAKQYSEDEGSKNQGGVAGWASAMPSPPPGPNDKPKQEAAQNFVPEFTAAALRLKRNEVSNPVRSTYGYHVLKAVDERQYQPADAESQKDPKKKSEAVDQYKNAVGSQIANGIFSEYRSQAKVEPLSPWLRGFLAEEAVSSTPPPTAPEKPGDPKDPHAAAKPASDAERYAPVIASYEEALKGNGPASGPGLAYKLVELYKRTGQEAKALEVLEKWAKRSGDAQMFYAQGEAIEKVKGKTEALAVYQKAMDQAFRNPALLGQLADKFKTLGRADLAEEARKKQGELLARQAAEEKKRQEEYARMMAEQAAAQQKAAAAAKPATGTTPDAGKPDAGKKDDTVAEITVKTGDIDPKTGKPKILSVTQSKPGEKPAENKGTAPDGKSDAKDTKPAAP